jgi:hypothetical protein
MIVLHVRVLGHLYCTRRANVPERPGEPPNARSRPSERSNTAPLSAYAYSTSPSAEAAARLYEARQRGLDLVSGQGLSRR